MILVHRINIVTNSLILVKNCVNIYIAFIYIFQFYYKNNFLNYIRKINLKELKVVF